MEVPELIGLKLVIGNDSDVATRLTEHDLAAHGNHLESFVMKSCLAVGSKVYLVAMVPNPGHDVDEKGENIIHYHRRKVELPLDIVKTHPLLLTKLTDMHCHAK